MKVGVLTVQIPFVMGGAELHAANLVKALREHGHEAEIIRFPFTWFPPHRIQPQILATQLLDVTESSGMRIDRVIGLKFPAYLMPHPNKVLWILHQHRAAYDLWLHEPGDLHGQPGGERAMQAIRAADARAIPAAKQVFTNSRRVSQRLFDYCGLLGEPLYHPPPDAELYQPAEPDDFLLMPSRINETKRQSLLIEALFHLRSDARVCILGRPDRETVLHALQARAAHLPPGRLRFLGGVSDEQKRDLYARCLAVVFIPLDEDYGYVTLEAMLAAKPVLTCSDSGAVLEFVLPEQTGLICPPDPIALAACIDRIWTDRPLARRLGTQAREHYRGLGLSWAKVVEKLLA